MPFISLLLLFIFIFLENLELHASALTAVAEIQPIEFQNQGAVPIRSLAFSPVDGRPHPVSGSMGIIPSISFKL